MRNTEVKKPLFMEGCRDQRREQSFLVGSGENSRVTSWRTENLTWIFFMCFGVGADSKLK